MIFQALMDDANLSFTTIPVRLIVEPLSLSHVALTRFRLTEAHASLIINPDDQLHKQSQFTTPTT